MIFECKTGEAGNIRKIISLIVLFVCVVLLPASVLAAPPTGETPFEPCLQDCLAPGSAPIKEMGAFQTSMFTGSATYSYPIDVPLGTNGLAPAITLSYNSHSAKDRTSWIGAGWNLNLNYVKRDVNSTPDVLSDDFFNLILNGQQHELVYNATEGRYHTEEESYLFIENKTGSMDNQKGEYWIVKSTDGTQYRFGYTDNSEAVCTNRDYVWQWSLDEVKDTHDNHLYYSYNESPTPNDLGAVYLAKIEYNNDKKRAIKFILEDTDRPDAITIYDQGCKVRYARRLKEIQAHADTEPVAKYVLSYAVNDVSTLSLLTQIQKIGSDGITALPPTTFEYEEIGVGWVRDDSWTAPTYLGGAHGFVVADVNGDGLTDVLRGYMYYDTTEPYPYEYFVNAAYINTGNGWVRDDSWAPPVPFVYDKRDDGRFWDRFQVSDINGDGLPDLFRGNDDVYINNGSGWEKEGDWDNPFTYDSKSGYRTADVNGDGLPDVLKGYMYYENYHEYFVNASWINTGSGWVRDDSWAPPVPFVYDKRDDGRFWDRYQIADINGDGLPDLFKSDESGAYINTGSGWEFDNWGTLPAFSGQNGYRIADVNGDGLPDVVRAEMVYEDYNEVFHSAAWINTGHGWASNANWAPPFPFIYNHEDGHSWTRAIPMDADGDGLVDIIHKFNAYIHAGASYAYRLKKIQNGIGGTLSIDYESTTTFPDTELGFVMQCAKNITKDNGMSGLHYLNTTNTLDYEGGRFNYSEQEFRGFSHVTVTDPLNNTHGYYFHQDDALKGKEYRTEIKDGFGNPYLKTENNWSYHESDGVYVTHLDERLDYTYDGEVSSPKITRTDYEYDEYGNIIRTATFGDVATTGDEKFVYNEYVYNTSAWIMNLVNHTYLLASDDATKVKESWYYYDGNHNPPTRGDLIMNVAWLDSGDDPTTYYGYDSYGNVIAKTDSKGNTVNYVYGLTHTFPEQVINALGHTTSYLYDLGTGNLLRVTDSNGFVTTYEYDVFGRLIKAIKPYDSTDFPTVTYNYDLNGVAPESSHSSMREKGGQTGTIFTHTFVDGFGQQIQTRYEAEDSTKEIVTNTFYDELGQTKKESLPYYDSYSASYTTPLPSVKGTSYEYDPVGRNTEIENPDGTTSTIEYDHWVRTSTDENGNQILSCTDAYDRIEMVEEKNDGETYTTVYDYNARDELINITDHVGNEFSYEYDTLGRKIWQHDPDMGDWTYSYDSNGNIISQTDARGITISFQYDELDRILKRDHPNDPDIDYAYDLEMDGTLSEVSDSLGTTHYHYDARLRTIEEERIMAGRTWITNWTYDSADRITSVTYPTGEMVIYNYNNQGLLESVPSIVDNIDYNELGRILRKVYGNTVSTDLEYNETTQRLKRIYTPGLQDLSYQYDNVGNIVAIENDREGKTQNFGYDDLNRLTSAEESGGYGLRTYSYDPIGNFIGLDAQDLDLIFTYGEGTAGPHAVTTRLTHAYNLFISTYSPLTNPTTIYSTPQTFNVTTNQICNITWLINCSIVQTNLSTTVASYTNDSAVLGIYNVTAIAENVNGTDSHSWVWNVVSLTLPVHNRNTSENFEGIQAAIDAVNTTDGHIIEVDSGTYNENVEVNKRLTLRGVDTDGGKPVVDAGGSGSPITLSVDGIMLEGFAATDSGIWPPAGIMVTSNNNSITNNTVNNNLHGIWVKSSSYNTITGNAVNNNGNRGIYMYSLSNDNIIIGNTANNNGYGGISLGNSSNNLVKNNIANNNHVGIDLEQSSNNNVIIGNTANFNVGVGIFTSGSISNNITDNTANNNQGFGISLRFANNNILIDNTFVNNLLGFRLDYYSNNNIITNNIADLNNYGIYLNSSDNLIYNNYFNNSIKNVQYDKGNNEWNITKTARMNIAGGPYLGGNYWSDYAGEDLDGDGLGDTPYNIGGTNKDYLPLIADITTLPIVVNQTSPACTIGSAYYSTIQEAVNNASAGNTIIVCPGSYTENVDITKSLTLKSYSGNPADTIVKAASSSKPLFNVTADYVNISGFTAEASWFYQENCLLINNSNHCNISNNTHNGCYITLLNSSRNTVTNIDGSLIFFYMQNSSSNMITNNDFSRSTGILLQNSGSNTVMNNDAYFIWLWNSDDNTITKNNVHGSGIYLGSSNNNMVANNNASNNMDPGIYLEYSNNNTVTNNIANSNLAWEFDRDYGSVYLEYSNNNTLSNNSVSNNVMGIELWISNNNTVTNNNASNNHYYGIDLFYSSSNTLSNNTASNNSRVGIWLWSASSNNTLINNTMSGNKYNFGSDGSIQNIDTSNTVDGKPIYYWVDQHDRQVPTDAGFVGIVNSTNITVKDLTLTKNTAGVLFTYTSNSRIENVTASDNWEGGIVLYSSSNNNITNNIVSNNLKGIYLEFSNNDNLIYNNYFNNNTWINAYDDGNNQWNITKTAGTNIVGGPYLGGNYWSDYNGNDTDKDGIGDTLLPYNTGITNGGDWLPLTPTNVSVETSTGTGTATFSTDSGLFADINGVAENSLPQEAKANKPEGLTLLHGLFNFTITDLTSGQSVTLTITLPSPVPVGGEWWKVNTTAGNNTWYSVPIGDDDGDNVVTITLTDGGLGDIDGAANGVIIDPSGIGILSALKPGIISYAPISPVNDSVFCTWRTFNVTVTQTVNVSWYLNESFLFKNESVTEARYTLHAGVIGEHNVTAIAENGNGEDRQVWVWNVTRLCGDVAPTGEVNMGDVILLLNHVGYPGNSTYALCNDWSGDCRCTGVRNMGDVVLLLNNVSYPEYTRYVLDCC